MTTHDAVAQAERHAFFSCCSADRVFDPECSTRQVYEEGAKRVALSVLTGINCG